MGGAALYGRLSSSGNTTTIYEAERPQVQTVVNSNKGQPMTPEQLYAANLASCVGITVSTTTVNIFGQTTTSAASGSGFVLSQDGYIATKASELHSYRDLTIRVGSSKYGQFREIGSDPSTDIAVVKVEAAGLHAPGPVSNDAAMGTLVVSNGSTTRTSRRPQLGTLSAEQRPIPNGDTAYLGVVFGTPCTIQEVTKDGPAAQAGAKAGDEILAVDGTPVTALDAVSPILSRKKVGERVTLEVKRKDKRLSYTITLGSRRQALGGNAPEDSNDLISGGFSKRRDDFPMVLQHDTPSRYTLMGGPLFNLKGELIGMNIARVNRAENYALPISVVQKSVQNILKNAPQPEK